MLKKLKINKEQKSKVLGYFLMGFGFLLFSNSGIFSLGCAFGYEQGVYDDDGITAFFFILIMIAGLLINLRSSYFRLVLIVLIIGLFLNYLLNIYFYSFEGIFNLFSFCYVILAAVLYLIYRDKDLNFQ